MPFWKGQRGSVKKGKILLDHSLNKVKDTTGIPAKNQSKKPENRQKIQEKKIGNKLKERKSA